MGTSGTSPWPAKEWAKEGGLSIWEAEPSSGCRIISGWVPQMGCWRTTPPIYPSKDVHTCPQIWAERSREVDLSCSHWQGLPKLDSEVDISAVQLVGYQTSSEWNQGPLRSGICAKKVAQTPSVWARKSTRDNKGYRVFLKRLPKAEEGRTARRRWRTRVCSGLVPLTHVTELHRVEGGTLQGSENLHWGQGSTLAGALAAAAMLEESMEGLSQSTTRMHGQMSAPLLPELRPTKKKILGAQLQVQSGPLPGEGHQSWSPLHSVQLAPHWWVTFLDPGMTSEEEQILGQTSADLDLGTPAGAETGPWTCFLQEPATMQEEGRGVEIFLKDPWKKTMMTGSSGGGIESACLNWWWELVGIPGINKFSGACPEDKGLLWDTPSEEQSPRHGEWLFSTSSP